MTERLTLLQLQTLIRSRLDEAFPLPVWVTAEISELKVNYSGHCYLELVEKGGANQVPKAKTNAVVWRSTFGAVSSYFRSATGCDLEAGMQVLLKVSVSYHELYGLSLVVSDIDPAYTIGDMERRRQETIRQLQQEGVYGMNRELDLPHVVQRIAVISSRNAAGYQDFSDELERSSYRFEVVLFDAVMQGNETENSIIDALERVMANIENFDAVVVIRGGGSQSDLACFDAYRLASHLAQFPLPVVTGIGHDKDESVADLVAAVALKTPTAVAAWLAERAASFDAWLDAARDEVSARAGEILDDARQVVQQHGFAISQAAVTLTHTMELRLSTLSGTLLRRQESFLAERINRLDRLGERLREQSAGALRTAGMRLTAAESLTESRQPGKILALGFAIVRKEGRAVKRSRDLAPGDPVSITLAEGLAEAVIQPTEKQSK